MIATPYKNYQTTSISTADRGKLVLMIYDHCIKWSRLAVEALEKGQIEKYSKSIFKIQDGITELTCALDMEAGGEVAKNLYRLYSFYNRHLTSALHSKDSAPVVQVQDMLGSLRGAWVQAIEIVRRENPSQMVEASNSQLRMVG